MTPRALFYALCLAWAASELWIGARHRSDDRGRARDRGTLRTLLVTIYASIALAIWLGLIGFARYPATVSRIAFWGGCAMMIAGMAFRWWSVRTLARLFTVDVAIREGHRLIRHGPYRLLRHPSYTGALATFYGFGLAFGDGLALLAIALPVTAAFIHRIRVEERVLTDAFPQEYPAYARATKRLIPYIW